MESLRMLVDAETLENGLVFSSDIVVVGAGPAGIVLSLEMARSGFEVVLIESGGLHFSQEIQDLGGADHLDSQFHALMSECTRRQVGGTSIIWGGRCLPYDPIDFDRRTYVENSNWPILYEEIAAYFQRASDYFLCGKPEFDIRNILGVVQPSIVPGLPDTHVITSTLERWSLPTNFGKEYYTDLKYSKNITLIYNLTCTEIETNLQGNHVELIRAKTLRNKRNIHVKGQKYVLASGALNTTRLLMVSDQKNLGGIGNHSGLLGRFYMGHLSGDIATAHFTTAPQDTIFGFDRDPDQVYLRRRFSFSREFINENHLPNIVAWLGVPEFGDPSHRNGILSLAYLALVMPLLKKYLTPTAIRKTLVKDGNIVDSSLPHLMNIWRDLRRVIEFIPGFGYERYLARRKIPALFVYNAANEYPLHYHSEQIPNSNSTVSLSDRQDDLGMRRLNINLQFTQQDIDSVVTAHKYWDEHLRRHNCGYLKYSKTDLEASIWEQAKDGFHQIGTTRMSVCPSKGVVDSNCEVHGVDNLFVASSSIFVTSGQANSTFMIVSFALRLADHLKKIQENMNSSK
jgi:choline dehydrogenase-like flavoprotein